MRKGYGKMLIDFSKSILVYVCILAIPPDGISTLFQHFELCHFLCSNTMNCIDSGYLVSAYSVIILCRSFK